MDLGRVFISSVFGGMLDRRQLAANAARLVGLVPDLTELHVAQTGTVQDSLTRAIERCDTYVGLFDTRRGTVPAAGTDGRAITEEEFRIARERGLRRLVFISETGSADRDRETAAALSVFRSRVVLTLSGKEGSLDACLHLEGVKPA